MQYNNNNNNNTNNTTDDTFTIFIKPNAVTDLYFVFPH